MPIRSAVAFVLLGVAGCTFSNAAPGAVILCAVDDDCPAPLQCELASHTCLAANAAAPVLESAAFDPPALSAGAVRLVVNADRALSADHAPTLAFAAGTPAPAFALLATDGAQQTLVADIDASVPAGLYALAGITITAADGVAVAQALTGVVFEVDRTAPGVVAAVIDAPVGGVYADVTGFDVVTAEVQPTEPVAPAAASLHVGGAAGDCAAGTGPGVLVCTLSITSASSDGVVAPHVTLADAAGNNADILLPAIRVDTAAPTVVDGSVAVSIVEGSAAVTTLGPAGVLTISLVTSEDVSPAPALALDVDGDAVPLALASANGRRFTYVRFGAGAVAPGTYGLVVDMADRFAHAATAVPVTLPAPFASGVAFVDDSAAGACPVPPGTLCVDLDGDGSFAASATCPEGDDFADLDPLAGPAALDLPGDGIDNNGIGGDAAISESAGLFVDVDNGDDTAGDGTRSAPFQSIAAAIAATNGAAIGWLFLAASATQYAVGADTPANVLGGLDPQSWTRTGAHSVLTGPTIVDGAVDSIDSDDELLPTGLVAHCNLGVVGGSRTAMIVDSRVGVVDLNGGDVLAFDSVIGSVNKAQNRLVLVRTQVDQGIVGFATDVTIVSSFVGGAGVHVDGGGSLGIYASTIRVPSGSAVDATQITSLVIINSVLTSDIGGAALIVGSFLGGVAIGNNDLFAPGAPVLATDDGPHFLIGVNACAFVACAAAGDNVAVDPDFTTLFHIDASSSLVDAVIDPLAGGAPTSALVDFDGACRLATGAADIGAADAP